MPVAIVSPAIATVSSREGLEAVPGETEWFGVGNCCFPSPIAVEAYLAFECFMFAVSNDSVMSAVIIDPMPSCALWYQSLHFKIMYVFNTYYVI